MMKLKWCRQGKKRRGGKGRGGRGVVKKKWIAAGLWCWRGETHGGPAAPAFRWLAATIIPWPPLTLFWFFPPLPYDNMSPPPFLVGLCPTAAKVVANARCCVWLASCCLFLARASAALPEQHFQCCGFPGSWSLSQGCGTFSLVAQWQCKHNAVGISPALMWLVRSVAQASHASFF